MRVYLDTNVFGRLFDDKSQLRIALESEACLIYNGPHNSDTMLRYR